MEYLDNHGLMSKFRVASGARIARPAGASWRRQQELKRELLQMVEVTPGLSRELAVQGLAGRHQTHLIEDRVLRLNDLDTEAALRYVEDFDALGALQFIFQPAKKRKQQASTPVPIFES